MGLGPQMPNASCSATKNTSQKTTTPITSEGSVLLRSNAWRIVPRSTRPSKPTRSRSVFASFDNALAMK